MAMAVAIVAGPGQHCWKEEESNGELHRGGKICGCSRKVLLYFDDACRGFGRREGSCKERGGQSRPERSKERMFCQRTRVVENERKWYRCEKE